MKGREKVAAAQPRTGKGAAMNGVSETQRTDGHGRTRTDIDEREQSAWVLGDRATFFRHFELLAEQPGAVEKMRELVLELAVRGKLVPRSKTRENNSVWQNFCKEIDERLYNYDPASLASFEIPDHWRWVTLEDVAQPCGQKKPDARFSYIDVGTINNELGIVSTNVRVFQADDAPSRARKLVKPDSVIYSTVRPYLRNIAVIDREFSPPAIVSTAFAVLHPKEFLNARYLFYWLRSATFQSEVSAKMKGVAYPAISDSDFWGCLIPVPPPSEQQGIVAKVDELMALCDELEKRQQARHEARAKFQHSTLHHLQTAREPKEFATAWHRVREQFQLLHETRESMLALREAILQLAVQGRFSFNDKIKMESKEIRFEEIIESSRYGTAKKCDFQSSGTPVLRIPNVVAGKIDLTSLKSTKLSTSEQRDLSLNEGDILIVRSNGSESLVGRAAVVSKEVVGFAYAGYLVRLRLKRDLADPEFVRVALTSRLVRNQIEGPIRTTSGVKNINTQEIYRLTFQLPPLAEQKRIVARVGELMRLCDVLEAQLNQSRTLGAHLLESTIHHILNPNGRT